MRIDDFDFDLPPESIALVPAAERDRARLLHVRNDGLGDHVVRELPDLLRADDVLVVNDTRVFPAALQARRPAREVGGGGDVVVDINLISPRPEAHGACHWNALVRPAKRLRVGDRLILGEALEATVAEKDEGGAVVLAFDLDPEALFAVLDEIGQMPLPPYIARRRPADATDKDRYQTVYADRRGSVAAPTAGLHFTDDLLSRLGKKGIETVRVTLHVGAGTFLPVTSEDTSDHTMHAEWGEITEGAATHLREAKAAGRRIVAVGTTATRLLETAARGGRIEPFRGETDIFIMPGFSFKAVDVMMTNFHLPKSTLLMLVSAFCGRDRILSAYAHAVEAGYRFYSYGDATLLERTAP